MKELIKRNLSGKKVLSLFLITNAVYVFMLTVTIPYVMSFSGGKKILAMMPTGYDTEYVSSLFSTLGESGRHAYLFNQLPIDMVYPILFAVSSCLLLAYFLTKLRRFDGPLFYLCFIPIFSGVFDYAENIGIVSILNRYPDHFGSLVHITSTFSVLKSICTTTYFVIVIVLLITLGITKMKNKTG